MAYKLLPIILRSTGTLNIYVYYLKFFRSPVSVPLVVDTFVTSQPLFWGLLCVYPREFLKSSTIRSNPTLPDFFSLCRDL